MRLMSLYLYLAYDGIYFLICEQVQIIHITLVRSLMQTRRLIDHDQMSQSTLCVQMSQSTLWAQAS